MPATPTRKLLDRLLTALGALVLLGVLAVVVVSVLVPALAGASARAVESASMAPALPAGSLVVDRPVDPDALRVGDIATYVQDSADGTRRTVTHRIVAIDHGGTGAPTFVFRGDANATDDPEDVPATAIQGRLWYSVPHLGGVRDAILGARWAITGLAVLGLVSYAIWQIAGGLRERTAAS